jgi:integrase
VSARLALVPAATVPEPAEAGICARLLDADFLIDAGWDAVSLTFSPRPDHLLLGRVRCVVEGCVAPVSRTGGLCDPCYRRHLTSGMELEAFAAIPHGHRRGGVGQCAVERCPRPWKSAQDRLCNTHSGQRRYSLRLPIEEFVRHPAVRPLPSYGPCQVAACLRQAMGSNGYCHTHAARYRRLRQTPGFDEQAWRATDSSVVEPDTVSFRGLPPRVVAELLYGIQERIRGGARTKLDELKSVCDGMRAARVSSILEHAGRLGQQPQTLLEHIVRHVRRAALSPEREVAKDVWDMFVFGHSGNLEFTRISQPWLREAAKRWAADDIPRRRGRNVVGAAKAKITSLARLSESLRAGREDGGAQPHLLERADLEHHLHRLAFLHNQDKISAKTRIRACRELKWLLHQMRALGLTRPGEPLAGLPDQFTLTERDIPAEQEADQAGRDLPRPVMRALCASLDPVGQRHPVARTAIELIMDTGRRPDEICKLPLDCLAQDPDGKHVLVYTNFKNNRERRLPIASVTAGLITRQQAVVREQFPDTPSGKLKLLPGLKTNPYGRKGISAGWLGDLHREWVDALPAMHTTAAVAIDGKTVTVTREFDKSRIFLYAYRHTYAQRHADAGVGIEVLCELMDHENIDTTRAYFQVGHERRRAAVDKVALMAFDRHGNRTWRETEQILESERLRQGLGQVAVPYGACSEPTNVQAGGGACPIRFRCLGCEHFDSNVSYLPDLEGYLADLLRNRERIASMTTADAWAKREAMPSEEEISRVRHLIRKIKSELESLTEEEQAEIREAVALVRRSRQVNLGMPRLHPDHRTQDDAA